MNQNSKRCVNHGNNILVVPLPAIATTKHFIIIGFPSCVVPLPRDTAPSTPLRYIPVTAEFQILLTYYFTHFLLISPFPVQETIAMCKSNYCYECKTSNMVRSCIQDFTTLLVIDEPRVVIYDRKLL